MGDRDYYRKESKGIDRNILTWVIIVNITVFAMLGLLWIVYLLTFDRSENPNGLFLTQVLKWFTLPSTFAEFSGRPWTLLVYMISQNGVMQMISNLLWLWAFGYLFHDLTGNNKLVPVYVYGGLVGGIFFLIAGTFVEHGNAPAMLGAGTSIMCLAIATTTLAPGYRLFPMLNGGIPLWILTVIFVLIDISVTSASASTAIAHIAAGGMGYLYIYLLKRGKDIGAWMNKFVNWLNDLFNPEKKYKFEKSRLFYKAKEKPFVKKPNLTQQKLDELLDKINQKGLDSLSEEEKAFLKKVSQQDL